ncbi:uncharacterized protein LOC142356250, partial [Convolutriloba macropyga]|uniref:uncharacterized protein LOC142356250 n=1 Tax=Convolutriloba macropyga TaxID=536237 RepID=UPI003F521B6D
YRLLFKSISGDKESDVLEVDQSLYPPNVSLSTSTDISDPTRIQLEVKSEAGTGSTIEVIMNTTNVVPRLVTKSFSPDLTFEFVNLKPGGFYQFLVTSYSAGGELRVSREFSPVSQVTFPGVPQEYSYSPVLTTSSVSVGFYLQGIYHGWSIESSFGPCTTPCTFDFWVSDFEVANMPTGTNVTISISASVVYPGHPMRVGNPLVIQASTYPALPVKTSSWITDTTSATVYFNVDGVKDGYLIESTRGSCITSCFVNSSVTSYTVTELDPGNSEIITVKAYVQYPGQDILAGASLDISVATLPDTPDIITVSTTNESITFQLEVPSGFCHGFLVLSDSGSCSSAPCEILAESTISFTIIGLNSLTVVHLTIQSFVDYSDVGRRISPSAQEFEEVTRSLTPTERRQSTNSVSHITIYFDGFGDLDGFLISSDMGSCASDCTSNDTSLDTWTINGLTSGLTVEIAVKTYKDIAGYPRVYSLPLNITFGTRPGLPSVITTRSCYSVTHSVTPPPVCVWTTFFYITDPLANYADFHRRSVPCDDPAPILFTYTSLNPGVHQPLWVGAWTYHGGSDIHKENETTYSDANRTAE